MAYIETSHKFSIPTLERENWKPQEAWIGFRNIWNSLPILLEEASVRMVQNIVAWWQMWRLHFQPFSLSAGLALPKVKSLPRQASWLSLAFIILFTMERVTWVSWVRFRGIWWFHCLESNSYFSFVLYVIVAWDKLALLLETWSQLFFTGLHWRWSMKICVKCATEHPIYKNS